MNLKQKAVILFWCAVIVLAGVGTIKLLDGSTRSPSDLLPGLVVAVTGTLVCGGLFFVCASGKTEK